MDRDRRERLGSAAAVVLIHLALGFALLRGLNVDLPHVVDSGLQVFALASPPAPPPNPPAPRPRRAAPRREGAAAPPNRTAKATPVVAPTPVIPLPVPPPVVVAPVAGVGAQDHAGAAPVRGPGSGSGGVGNGTGSGGNGDGPGGGGDGSEPPGWIGGRLRDSDYPAWASRARITGTVIMRIDVTARGRISACSIIRSSGNAPLDALTCRLIGERLRYDPARDAAGRKVAGTTVAEQSWGME